MAETSPLADLDSAASCSNDDSMQSSEALQLRISRPSMRMHRVQAWLVSNNATWSSLSPQDLVTSEGECNTKDEYDAASEGHACAAPAQQNAEKATALKRILAKQDAVAASEQPAVLNQLTSDQCTIVQQHFMKESAEQSASSILAGAASQQVSVAAAAAMRRSAVHALVQRFEHMTVARLKASKPGDAGLGVLTPTLSDKASQQRLPEVKMHAMPERAPNAASVDDDSVIPSRQLQLSCAGEEAEAYGLRPAASHDMPWVDYPPTSQPPEWHLNTAFEIESSSAEQAESEPALTRYNELAAPGATGVGHTAAQLWPEGLDVAADEKEVAVQRSGEAVPRYAVASHAPATPVHAYRCCDCHCASHCYCCCYCRSLYCTCVVKQEVSSWHTAR